jgi:hypothetical protein
VRNRTHVLHKDFDNLQVRKLCWPYMRLLYFHPKGGSSRRTSATWGEPALSKWLMCVVYFRTVLNVQLGRSTFSVT